MFCKYCTAPDSYHYFGCAMPVVRMTTQETYSCPAETHPASYHVDPQPAEFCEEEVEWEGEFCSKHEAADEDWTRE